MLQRVTYYSIYFIRDPAQRVVQFRNTETYPSGSQDISSVHMRQQEERNNGNNGGKECIVPINSTITSICSPNERMCAI